ncbi:MAG: hypothetical protein HMLKMBBP_00546 [Planctomycetes bacterium]|nr:hypothetical protein [Planctomycetota bacterium]
MTPHAPLPSPQALALLRVLVEHIRTGTVRPDDPRTFLSYKQAHDRLGLDEGGDTIGNSLKRQGLQELAEWAKRERLPAVTGLIIDRDKLHPGNGYYELHRQPRTAVMWWLAQVDAAVKYDWSPYLAGV